MSFTTRFTILNNILNVDDVSWNEFYDFYSPLIHLRGKSRGLSQTECEELVQDVMMSFFKGLKKFQYDPSKGRFRSFFKTIIDRRAIDIMRGRKKKTISMDESMKDSLPSDENIEDQWESEWKKRIFEAAVEKVKHDSSEQTFKVFESCVLNGEKPKDVAKKLKMSVNSVYFAKHRVMVKLKQIVERLEKV